MCNTSVRSVYEALKQLQAFKEVMVIRQGGRYGTHAYIITLPEETSTLEETSTTEEVSPVVDRKISANRSEDSARQPEDFDMKTGRRLPTIHHEPSINHQEPPGGPLLILPPSEKTEPERPVPDKAGDSLTPIGKVISAHPAFAHLRNLQASAVDAGREP